MIHTPDEFTWKTHDELEKQHPNIDYQKFVNIAVYMKRQYNFISLIPFHIEHQQLHFFESEDTFCFNYVCVYKFGLLPIESHADITLISCIRRLSSTFLYSLFLMCVFFFKIAFPPSSFLFFCASQKYNVFREFFRNAIKFHMNACPRLDFSRPFILVLD